LFLPYRLVMDYHQEGPKP